MRSCLSDIDALVQRFYGVFDNRSGQVQAVSGFVGLFAPGAQIVSHSEQGVSLQDPGAFVQPRLSKLAAGVWQDFHEWETWSNTELHGSMAIRHSRYAKQGVQQGLPFQGTGTKHFQLANLPEGWRIVCVSWIDDHPQAERRP